MVHAMDGVHSYAATRACVVELCVATRDTAGGRGPEPWPLPGISHVCSGRLSEPRKSAPGARGDFLTPSEENAVLAATAVPVGAMGAVDDLCFECSVSSKPLECDCLRIWPMSACPDCPSRARK